MATDTAPTSATAPTEDAVRAALSRVNDPEIHRPITDLGMVKSVEIAADGVVQTEVQNSGQVDAFCTVNHHIVRLVYRLPADTFQFGPLFVGLCRSLSVRVENRGTDDLHVGSPATAGPGFSASPSAPFTLRPGEQACFEAINRMGPGSIMMTMFFGAGPLYVTLKRM